MWRRAANIAWWLGLAAYFGGILTLAVAAPAVFHTTRDAGITMPGIVSPPLDVGPHAGAQAGGEIFGAILDRFAWIELVALALMLLGLAGFLFSHTPVRRTVWVLLALWILLSTALGYDSAALRPAVLQARNQLRQSAANHVTDTTTWPERTTFDQLHNRSTTLAEAKAYLLLALLLISAWRNPQGPSTKSTLTRSELMR